ncbi:MAG: flagellar motor protein MotD, partial [Betaproteobacteria bacterium]|nr:flagellar motor protein MotD [Betaproteobacteria bacterium]
MLRRKRKQKIDDHIENHERWLVSYADFITLLFAFFVVMYAVSSVNEGKYHVLSSSLVSAFKNNDSADAVLVQSTEFIPINIHPSIQTDSIKPIDNLSIRTAKKQEKMKSMAKDILHALDPLVKDGQVRVTQSSRGITVEINASVLFSPGQAKLAENSSLALQSVANV